MRCRSRRSSVLKGPRGTRRSRPSMRLLDNPVYRAILARVLSRGAGGPIAFAADKERRTPEVVFVQEAADELAEGGQVVFHSAEVRTVARPVGAAEARAHGVDEHQVAGIEQAVGIIDVSVRRG